MNWTNGLFWLWAVGSVLWATFIGLLLRDKGEEAIQVVALGPPLVILALGSVLIGAAFRRFRRLRKQQDLWGVWRREAAISQRETTAEASRSDREPSGGRRRDPPGQILADRDQPDGVAARSGAVEFYAPRASWRDSGRNTS